MRISTRVALAAAVGLVSVAAATPSVAASCAGPPIPVSQAAATAPAVFVGTVTGTSDNGRTATVHVDELWRGPALPAEVTLHGSPDTSAAATSVDRRYDSGAQYLFIPNSGSGSEFSDNSCSMTQPFIPAFAAYRPAGALRYPAAAAPHSYAALALVLLAVLGGVGVAALHLRHRSRYSRNAE